MEIQRKIERESEIASDRRKQKGRDAVIETYK